MNKKLIAFVVIAVLVGAAVEYLYFGEKEEAPSVDVSIGAFYLCKGGKTIDVDFRKGTPQPVVPGEPPVPTGSADIVLSDGRNLDLSQTISASGARYANEDESFVFWIKGNGALVLENNIEKSYIGCIVLAPDPGGLPQSYAEGSGAFSVRYPQGYTIDPDYQYQYLGPGREIYGVKMTIPASLAAGKNLSSYDTGVSVEMIPAVQGCNAGLFLERADDLQNIVEEGVEYSFASTNGAAAGNFYEEKVWAYPYTNPCIAVRYLIHSTNIGNYEPGAVQEFDRAGLLEQFDKIRRSLTIN